MPSLPTPHTRDLRPAELPARSREVTQVALACGALEPLPTRVEIAEHAGVRFQLRVLESIRERERVTQDQRRRAAQGRPSDPFGPCDPHLLLGDLSPTHCCVLNKFPALGEHLLIVTRDFEPQERLLTVADLHALWLGLAGIDGLGFYNGGRLAGASQPHKHLQLISLPMHPGEPGVPLEARLRFADFHDGIGHSLGLPFEHALARLPANLLGDCRQAAVASLGLYHRLLEAVGLPRQPGSGTQPGPYNLLVTRRWMLLVPRRREGWQGCSINALGFAGSLLARDGAELERIRRAGPMRLLGYAGRSP